MAKKTPKKQTPVVESQKQPIAAVKVDSPKKEPKKTKKDAKKNSANAKPNIFKRMGKGIKGTFSELKKVAWPKGKEVGSNTAVVLVVVVLFFIILFIIDYVLSGLFGLVTNGVWTRIFT